MASITCYAFNLDNTLAFGMLVRLQCLSRVDLYRTQTVISDRGCSWDLSKFQGTASHWKIGFNTMMYGNTSWPWVDVSLQLEEGESIAIILHIGPESYNLRRTVLPLQRVQSQVQKRYQDCVKFVADNA
jgi:hypothetical protein